MNLLDLFRRPAPPALTEHQLGVQARAVRHLVDHGSITALDVQNLGTTSAHRLLNRLRRMGYLYEVGHPRGYVSVPNASGYGFHKRHYWTGKRPERKRSA